MAENSDSDARWPGVSVTDTTDCCTVFLKIQNLKVKKKHGIFGALQATNADIEVKFSKKEIFIKVTVKDSDDDRTTLYEYKKRLPKEINEEKSKWEVFKENRLKVELYKAKPESWISYMKMLQERE